MLFAERWIAHPFCVALEVFGLDTNLFGHFGVVGLYGTQAQHQLFDLPIVEKPFLMSLHPLFLLLLIVRG